VLLLCCECSNWEVIAWILGGLITIKTSVVAALGLGFGLTRYVAG
jgi:hypothetical protein